MLKFNLPIAPGLNNATRNIPGMGRAKTALYKKWIKQADAHYVIQQLGRQEKVRGPYACVMRFQEHLRGDLDGRAKLILDWMVSRNITDDDSNCRELSLKCDGRAGKAFVEIEVTPYAGSLVSGEPGSLKRAA